MECLVTRFTVMILREFGVNTRFMVMILREFGVNPPRIKVISVKVMEMDGMWSIYGVRTQAIYGYSGGSW
ncbi:hypothetical protein Tco_0645577 [Tanacetum coccineum]